MTDRRDAEALLRAFYAEGQTQLPDRAYRTVHDRVDRTRQRVVIGSWEEPRMSTLARVAVAAAAVVAITVVGLNLVARTNELGPGAPTQSVVPSVTPSVVPSAGTNATASTAPLAVSNGLIAYSTLPGLGQLEITDILHGGDLYLIREGGEPRLIAGRGDGTTRNVCPAFSPDGNLLAFGAASPKGRAVEVVTVNPDGSTATFAHIAIPGTEPAVCPRWSADGARVAYLDGGTFVIRAMDGTTRDPADGDPSAPDFAPPDENGVLVSPSGDLVADEVRTPSIEIVVANVDGSEARTVYPNSLYSIAAWSPDSRRLLVMEDVSGIDFAIHAVSVDSPFDVVTIVSKVRVNSGRSFPGRGDVAWQPVFR
jgi:WD40-like Beta Propeller Repeat